MYHRYALPERPISWSTLYEVPRFNIIATYYCINQTIERSPDERMCPLELPVARLFPSDDSATKAHCISPYKPVIALYRME